MSSLSESDLRIIYQTLDYGDEEVPEDDRQKIKEEVSKLYDSFSDKTSSHATTIKMMLDMFEKPKYKIGQVVSTVLGVIGEMIGWRLD